MNRRLSPENNTPMSLATVSIVSHGDAEEVFRLLASLCKFEQVKSIQVIITDNLGDELPEVDSAHWSSLIILRNERPRGFAHNHNQAFRFATGQYFWILNPDVVFNQKVFHHLINIIENGSADIVAPLIRDKNAVFQDSYRDFPTPFEVIRRRLPGYHFFPPSADAFGLVHPDWIAGIFMLMKSETYRDLKGFDENYRLYFEDVDFCARAQLAGLKLLVDTKVSVQHDAHRASKKKLTYLLWHIQSAFRFFTSPVYNKVKQR